MIHPFAINIMIAAFWMMAAKLIWSISYQVGLSASPMEKVFFVGWIVFAATMVIIWYTKSESE